jgi:hypothetical protein
VDLRPLAGSSVTSVSTELSKSGDLIMRLGLGRGGGQGPDTVLALSGVGWLCIDGDSLGSWVDELVVRRLPQFGAWPPEAQHLLWLHNNHEEWIWLRSSGPEFVEIVARELRIEGDGYAPPVDGA